MQSNLYRRQNLHTADFPHLSHTVRFRLHISSNLYDLHTMRWGSLRNKCQCTRHQGPGDENCPAGSHRPLWTGYAPLLRSPATGRQQCGTPLQNTLSLSLPHRPDCWLHSRAIKALPPAKPIQQKQQQKRPMQLQLEKAFLKVLLKP